MINLASVLVSLYPFTQMVQEQLTCLPTSVFDWMVGATIPKLFEYLSGGVLREIITPDCDPFDVADELVDATFDRSVCECKFGWWTEVNARSAYFDAMECTIRLCKEVLNATNAQTDHKIANF